MSEMINSANKLIVLETWLEIAVFGQKILDEWRQFHLIRYFENEPSCEFRLKAAICSH